MNLLPVLITLLAGLATVVGALFVSEKKNEKLSSVSLAFATGIMLMVALGELIPEATESFGIVRALLFLVLGGIISLVLDIVLPHHHHEHHDDDDRLPGHFMEECECTHNEEVSKGMIIALLLHNVLEGLATGITVVGNTRLGISMALGIAIHNIPIGSTLALSVISSGKTKGRAVRNAALIGLSQAVGALVGCLFFENGMPAGVLEACMAIVAGILVFISFDELWPAARKGGSRNLTIIALLIGISFIPLTELLLQF